VAAHHVAGTAAPSFADVTAVVEELEVAFDQEDRAR